MSADGEDSCMACVNNLCQKLDCGRVCDHAFTIFLIPHTTPKFVLSMLVLCSMNVSNVLLHQICKFLLRAKFT